MPKVIVFEKPIFGTMSDILIVYTWGISSLKNTVKFPKIRTSNKCG